MPTVARLSEVVTRVVAPNPSHVTLDGTNTYVVRITRSGTAVVVDPGPSAPEHRARVEAVLAERDMGCELVMVTHYHHHHTEAARAWADHYGSPVAPPGPRNIDERIQPVMGGQRLTGPLTLEAVLHTRPLLRPHRLPAARRGDAGRRPHPRRRHRRGRLPRRRPPATWNPSAESSPSAPTPLLPGHGPELGEDPSAVIRYYLDHRAFREAQILEALGVGLEEPKEMVRAIYADVPEIPWPAAEASTRAALAKLAAEGRVRDDGDRFCLLS